MALRADTKIDLMRRVPLFVGCSRRELREIAALADELDFPAGQELIREGERGREFFVVVEGTAEVRRNGRRVDTLGPGDFAGEMALLTHTPRNATVKTTSPVRALVLAEREFRSLLDRSPQVQVKVLLALAERLAPLSL
jgi:CRP/FNR family cyclic AMP-dependent transcriptional regulator